MSTSDSGDTGRRDFLRRAGGVLGAGAALAVTGGVVNPATGAASPGIDSFNDFGPWTYLAPGASAGWWISFGGNPGAQLICPDVKSPGVRHNTSNFGKAIFNGYTEYYATITNAGGAGAYHNIQGGGLT